MAYPFRPKALTDQRSLYRFDFTAAGGEPPPPPPDGDPQPPAGGVNSISIVFNVESQDVLIAPTVFFCTLTSVTGGAPFLHTGAGTYDPKFHEYDVIWWVEGQPFSAYTAPQNMVTGWNNPNISYGAKAALGCPVSGTYTIWCMVSDRAGNYGLGSVTKVVGSANARYPTTQTICLSPSGNFTGKPSGAQEVTTAAAAQTIIQAATTPTRLLIHRGETVNDFHIFTVGGRLDHVGAYGTGADPILRSGQWNSSHTFYWHKEGPETQITIENVVVDNWWDARTETGTHNAGGSVFFWREKLTSSTMVVYNVTVQNMSAIEASANFAPCQIAFINCTIRGWRDYGFYCGKNELGKYAWLGCCVAQWPDALNGGPKQGLSNNHGPIRIVSCRWIVGDICDLFSNNGWSGGYDTQPCLRVGTSQTANLDIFLHWGRTVMENGYQAINMEGENTTAQDNPGNFVYDRILIICTARARASIFSVHKFGTTIRNLYVFKPNSPVYDGNAVREVVALDPNNAVNNNNSEPVQIYNVTAYIETSSANQNGSDPVLVTQSGVFGDVTIQNNIFHAPNATTPAVGSSPVNVSTNVAGVTPRYIGVQYNFKQVTGSLASDVLNGGTLVVPYSSILIVDQNDIGPGTATDQAYWTALSDTKHAISVSDVPYYAENSEIAVSFGASSVTITNNTGATWPAGSPWFLKLDRISRLDTDLPLATQYANPAVVKDLVPTAGSSALDPNNGQQFAIRDWLGEFRPRGNQDAGHRQVTTA